MNTNKIINIGKALIKHSDDFSLQELSQNELLAPYLVQASKTMSLRQISSFISEKFEVSISASTISRILNNKEEHYHNIASHIKKAAQWIALKHETIASRLLAIPDLEFGETSSALGIIYDEIQIGLSNEADNENLIRQSKVVSNLIDTWENMPNEAQDEILEIMKLEPDLT